MSRLCLAALALLAVVAAVSAGGAPAGSSDNAPQQHKVRAWLKKKAASLHSFASKAKTNVKDEWKSVVLPKLNELKKTLGAEIQKNSPKALAAIKNVSGSLLKKALAYLQGGTQPKA